MKEVQVLANNILKPGIQSSKPKVSCRTCDAGSLDPMNRRTFLRTTAQAGALGLTGLAGSGISGCASGSREKGLAKHAADDKHQKLVAEGFRVALDKYLYPSLLDRIYPGHFIIAPDGGFGTENTWPG